MSRAAQSRTAPVLTKKAAATTPTKPEDEICPICKSSRYLNATLELRINPECYHKMCEACVDRIFGHGPATCPIPGCGRTLRKARFRKQTFEDIRVEREVDIRRRVAAAFNKREEDFEDLRAYNNYLNEVEDMTFDLINNIDYEANMAKLEQYQKANQGQIAENKTLAMQEKAEYAAQQKRDKESAKLRREAARREDEEERRETAETKREIIQKLASSKGGDASKIAKQGQQVQLKRRLDRQAAVERSRQLQATNGSATSMFEIKGLKQNKDRDTEAPVSPFGGYHPASKYYTLQSDYSWEGIQEPSKDINIRTGGYSLKAFETRALCEAFGGLGVFVADEYTDRTEATEDDLKAGTQRAAIAAQDVQMTA